MAIISNKQFKGLAAIILAAKSIELEVVLKYIQENSISRLKPYKKAPIVDKNTMETVLKQITDLAKEIGAPDMSSKKDAPKWLNTKLLPAYKKKYGFLADQAKKPRKKKTTEIKKVRTLDISVEDRLLALAIDDLRNNHTLNLDPVSGDACCEMRVPFILDVYDYLQAGHPNRISSDKEDEKNDDVPSLLSECKSLEDILKKYCRLQENN